MPESDAEGICEVIALTLSKLPGFEVTEVMENALSLHEADRGYFIDVETSGRLYHVTVQPSPYG